jgi:hypothetical protein
LEKVSTATGVGETAGLGHGFLDCRPGEAGLQVHDFLERAQAAQGLEGRHCVLHLALRRRGNLLGEVLYAGGPDLAGLQQRVERTLAEGGNFFRLLDRLAHVLLQVFLSLFQPGTRLRNTGAEGSARLRDRVSCFVRQHVHPF